MVEYENEKKGILIYTGTYRVEKINDEWVPVIYLKGRKIKLVESNNYQKIFYTDYDENLFKELKEQFSDIAEIKDKTVAGKHVIKITGTNEENTKKIAEFVKARGGKTYEIQFGGVKYFTVKSFRPYFYIEAKDEKKFKVLMRRFLNEIPEEQHDLYKFKLQPYKAKNGDFIKVIMTDPRKISKVRDYLEENGVTTYEADVAFVQRYLLDRKFTIVKPLPRDIIYYDIEVLPHGGNVPDPEKAPQPIITIAYYTGDGKKGVYLLPPDVKDPDQLKLEEMKILKHFFNFIEYKAGKTPDHFTTIAGWNSLLFDWPYLKNRAHKLNTWLRGYVAKKLGTYLYETYVYTIEQVDFKNAPFKWKFAGKRGEDYRYIFYTYSREDEEKLEEWIEENYEDILVGIRSYKRRDFNDVIKKIEEDPLYKKYHIELPLSVTNVDVMLLYKKFVNDKLPTYKLDEIAKLEGFEGKVPIDIAKLEEIWRNNPELLIEYNLHDAELVLKIDEKRELVRQLYSLSELTAAIIDHVHTEKTPVSAKKLIDALLLGIAKEDGIVLPTGRDRGDDEEKYSGAYVHEPKKGVYQWVGVLDFNSLYPTIIRAFNISPETWVPDDSGDIKAPNGSFRSDRVGLLVKAVNVLFEMKMQIKRQLGEYAKKYGTSSPEYRALKARYQAVKGVLNSVYGVTGYKKFRLYKKEIAENITTIGRTVWHKTKEFAEEMGYTVVYGDSVTADAEIIIKENGRIKTVRIEELFSGEPDHVKSDGREYKNLHNIEALTLDNNNRLTWAPIKYVMRHKINKKVYHVITSTGRSVRVTEDHSIFVLEDGKLTEKRAGDLNPGDIIIETPFTEIYTKDLPETKPWTSTVIEVKEVDYDDYVYDIEVGGTHKFFANGILVHNTDSQYYLLKSKTPEEAVKELEWLAEELTKKVQQWVTEEFNARGEYFEFDPDEIFQVVGFIAKKNYVGYVIYKDGQILEEPDLVYAGLLSRGDVSDAVKKFLMDVIDAVLLGGRDPWEVINKWKQEVLSGKWDNEVVIWKSLNKDPNSYKSIQPHVRAYKMLIERGVNPLELTKVGFVKVGPRKTDLIALAPGETVTLTQVQREFVWKNQFEKKIEVIKPILPPREEKKNQKTLFDFAKK